MTVPLQCHRLCVTGPIVPTIHAPGGFLRSQYIRGKRTVASAALPPVAEAVLSQALAMAKYAAISAAIGAGIATCIAWIDAWRKTELPGLQYADTEARRRKRCQGRGCQGPTCT